ncbi:hypothetical protein [Mucilaginibacter lappiensis]|uniref:Uncharacterized protein n=1 Tax=Mucilaginibacter lappiensis TaxID=354630 RepID=A0A1N7F0G6_9SPHI|nr:hypothetical protein [Mucilaginibacter lappiensis]MBB6112143.1 hypothetical protein [Mucilaginibacter lappiensis]MBB6131294.1 hypothetical protein [Mucilaginibacter lappiensis]SIR93807.1 hypothetical protein SAMN05421821_11637 [Mucilaginibacter lappiensis]
MKKLLLMGLTSFLSIGAYAQSPYGSARELKCTEEAVTFSTNIRSGWHLYSPHMGYADMLKSRPNFTPSNLYTTKNDIPESSLPANFEKAFNSGAGNVSKPNRLLQKMMQAPLQPDETPIKRTYIIYDYSRFLPLANTWIITLN